MRKKHDKMGLWRPQSKLSHLGRDPFNHEGVVSPPVYHASTILFENASDLKNIPSGLQKGVTQYGRLGTPTTFAFEEAIAALEGGFGAVAMPSGLGAIVLIYLATAKTGDHVLVSDSVYSPNRSFCEGPLRDNGIEVEFFDPAIGAGIEALMKPNTKLVFLESPGSLTFDVQDIPAISEVAHAAGALVAADNTWASPLFCNPLALGADFVAHAVTKYINGHSDAMLGVTVAKDEDLYQRLRARSNRYGYAVAPDDLFLALRGLRTLSVRLKQHEETALALARWLETRPEVERVLHPALPSHPGHALWQRDFSGSSGLFGVVLKSYDEEAVNRLLNHLELFGLGYSWGGFESLCVPANPQPIRSATNWDEKGPALRLYAGLEAVEDLKEDFSNALEQLGQYPSNA